MIFVDSFDCVLSLYWDYVREDFRKMEAKSCSYGGHLIG